MKQYLTLKICLVAVILLILCFPYFQEATCTIPLGQLNGVTSLAPKPEFTYSSWISGDYQKNYQQYTEENIGMRNFLIRLRNQVDYSVFHTTITPGVIIGNDNVLFVEDYLKNYLGITFKGDEQIDAEISGLQNIQQELKKHNVDFLLVFAPGKATMFPENIPSYYLNRKKGGSNYESYIKRIKRSDLNFIDLNAWFLSMKGKAPYPLYPINGAHWTTYGVGLAADTLIRYIEKKRNIDLPELSWDKVVVSDSMRYSDYDIGEMMNLFRPLKNNPMPYPVFRFNTEGKARPKVVSISDSYWWAFSMTGIAANIFYKDNYWFYFKDVYENEKKIKSVQDVDLKTALLDQDLVIMMITEATYMLFPYGFIDAFNQKCLNRQAMTDEEKLNQYMNKIKSDPEWYRSIQEKARKNGVPVEEQMAADAKYLLDQERTANK